MNSDCPLDFVDGSCCWRVKQRSHRLYKSTSRWKTRILGSLILLSVIRSFCDLAYADLSLVHVPTTNPLTVSSFDQRKEGSNPCGILRLQSVTFNPRSFMIDGPGKPYLRMYHKQLRSSSNKGRLLKVRFVLYDMPSSCRPIYYHIHKNGGSTMNIKGKNTSTSVFTRVYPYYTPQENEMGRAKFENETMNILRQVENHQQQGSTMMPIITFLRDPVRRFLSSVGQALKLNKLSACTRKLDTKDTIQLLDCVLSKIQENDHFLDEHLEPQIFELFHGMMGLNLNVQVMDLKWMDATLDLILGFPSRQVSRRQTKGLVAGFNLSATLLTPALIQRICTLYYIDVLLLQETRTSSSLCEEHESESKSS